MARSNKSVLKASSTAELLSYIINQNPILSAEIDLPVQGQNVQEIGKIIVNNQRYRNAFINTVNLIGLTVIKRNGWTNPWDFTFRGELRFGQQVREIINDLAHVYDYNENFENKTRFLKTVVPNVYQYLHEVNFQKFYETTTSDSQLAMAFNTEDSLYEFIDNAIGMLYESLQYDTYLVNKYMLCRRLVDGTITMSQITDFANKDPRQIASFMQSVSNKLTFRSPNYNPAGIRRATSFDDQIIILNTDYDAQINFEVIATSFYKENASLTARIVLIDGFNNFDDARLQELLGTAYTPFTEAELASLANVPAVIISREWFMNYYYLLDTNIQSKETYFYNPTTLENNHFLHAWRVFSTSPFENAVGFTSDTPSVTTVEINPSEVTLTAGLSAQFTATVTTQGLANKAVVWKVDEAPGEKPDGGKVTISNTGLLSVPSDYTPTSTENPNPIVISATSIYDNTKVGNASITVL